jgi:hypothetical protein
LKEEMHLATQTAVLRQVTYDIAGTKDDKENGINVAPPQARGGDKNFRHKME